MLYYVYTGNVSAVVPWRAQGIIIRVSTVE